MKLFLIVLIILLLIFIIPFPLMCRAYYSNENYYVKLYKFIILSKKKNDLKLNKQHNASDKINSINMKILIKKLNNMYFKPIVKFNGNLDYSLNDSAVTAIFLGVFSMLPNIIFILINRNFNCKKFKFNINPIFEDKYLLKIEISSIFILSFAQIIYIIILLKNYRNELEVNP